MVSRIACLYKLQRQIEWHPHIITFTINSHSSKLHVYCMNLDSIEDLCLCYPYNIEPGLLTQQFCVQPVIELRVAIGHLL